MTTPPTNDPVEMVRRLDADAIQKRLEQMREERQALLVLLRAALRGARRKGGTANVG